MISPVTARRRAFTLLELMIAVCIVGVLASVAIPSYSRYTIQSRATEIPMNLSMLFRGAVAYWDRPFSSAQGIGATKSGHCTTIECCFGMMGTIPPLFPTPQKRPGNFSGHEGMRDLGFAPEGGMTYGSYAWAITDQGGNVGNCGLSSATFTDPWVYEFIGIIDLNGDGRVGGSVLQVGIREDQLYRSPGYMSLASYLGGAGACPFCADGFVD